MDAYSDYIVRLSEAQLGELRREAEELRMSRAAAGRGRRASLRELVGRAVRRRRTAGEPVAPVALPTTVGHPETELRRSA
ncbi:MAG: hypothetical protein LC799_26870 [Actinobacteria bacterium]|nr:hypothetical protein [Actinomycetota bacterium]